MPFSLVRFLTRTLQALEKYRYEQSLEHMGQFIEKLEKELEECHEHLVRYEKREGYMPLSSTIDT